jgi:voltage-gated potassium channel Kch
VVGLVVAAAVLTMLLSSVALRVREPLLQGLQRVPLLGRRFADTAVLYLPGQVTPSAAPAGSDRRGPAKPVAGQHTPAMASAVASHEAGEPAQELTGHAVVVGFGRIGHEVVDALQRRGFRVLVIEHNPHLVRQLRATGMPCIYGDVASPTVLEHANLPRARVLALTIPDDPRVEVATRRARELAPQLDIVVRSSGALPPARLEAVGAGEVVLPAFEAALEFVRHVLRSFGLSTQEVQMILARRRADATAAQARHTEPGM